MAREKKHIEISAMKKINRQNLTRKNMILPLLAEINGSIHVGLAAMGVGIGIGLTGLGMTTAVGRNPGAFTPVLVHAILAIALTEAIVFYALYLIPH
jgi:F-type H+-transporting ATPase subunit c